MNKIFVFCPGDIVSGGVNSLHLLCKSLINNGFNAGMYYINPKKEIIEGDIVKSFNVPVFAKPDDCPQHTVLVPETMVKYLSEYQQAKKAVYWLSTIFFFKNPPFRFPFSIKLFRKVISLPLYDYRKNSISFRVKIFLQKWNKKKSGIWDSDVWHIANSYYIASFLNDFGIKKVSVLHNPVRNEFYDHQINHKREKTILVGPKTSKRLVYQIKQRFREYKVIRVKHMKPDEVFSLFRKSLLFVELGNANRDRTIREAVLLGCIVLVSNTGGNKNYLDTPLPDYYKIIPSNNGYKKMLFEKIQDITDNYAVHRANLDGYRAFLVEEKQQFEARVKDIFGRIMNQ